MQIKKASVLQSVVQIPLDKGNVSQNDVATEIFVAYFAILPVYLYYRVRRIQSKLFIFAFSITVKTADPVTSIQRDPAVSGQFRVPPNDF